MPLIGGRYYANPAYGRALERARRQAAIEEGDKLFTDEDSDPWEESSRRATPQFAIEETTPIDSKPAASDQAAEATNEPLGESVQPALPGPLRWLKENPDALFLQRSTRQAPTSTAPQALTDLESKPGLVPDFSAIFPAPRLTPPRLGWFDQSGRASLPAPLQRLQENPEDLFLRQSLFSAKSENAIHRAAQAFGFEGSDFQARILQAAAANALDPNLLVGLAMRESSLKPDAGKDRIGSAKGLY